jgi:hypothetical protein
MAQGMFLVEPNHELVERVGILAVTKASESRARMALHI